MITYDSNLTTKGQVTVPASIRRRLGLKPGESVRFRITSSNQVVIEKNDWKKELDSLHQEVASHLQQHNIKPLDTTDLDQIINQAAEEAVTKEWEQGQDNG